LNASLSLLLEAGQEAISESIRAATKYLVLRIKTIPNMEIISQISGERFSGIVTFKHQRMPSPMLHQSLMQCNIICAQRGGGIRFSPHFYINNKQMNKACEHLQRIVQSQ